MTFQKIPSFIKSLIISYPSSKTLSYFWNAGSFLGFVLVVQIASGLLLVFFYTPHTSLASFSVDYLSRDVWFGFLPRILHLSGATLFSFILLFHISRGIMNRRYILSNVWWRGTTILLIQMAIAFLGYVLVWGQMSLWGATVITNLISAIPYIGSKLVFWFWGGFRLNSATLSFFFTLHYLLPFVLLVIVFVHLILLHETSSRRRIQVHERFTKVKFNPFYSFKDILNILLMSVFYGIAIFSPWSFGDPENWALANPIVSPVHIQPEWYFLFAYEILRSIPNKLGGVIALVLSILFLYLIPLFPSRTPQRLFLLKLNLSFLIHVFLILTWLGRCTVAEPFIFVGKIYTCLYFLSLTMFILIWVFSIISISVLQSLGSRSTLFILWNRYELESPTSIQARGTIKVNSLTQRG